MLAQADNEALRVRVNRKEYILSRPDVWTTTYWRLPHPQYRKQAMALLDCDTGKYLRADLQYVGAESVPAAGQVQQGVHYRLRGDVTVDVWYDGQERLIHEDYTEDGHRIVLDLIRIRARSALAKTAESCFLYANTSGTVPPHPTLSPCGRGRG